MKRTLLSLALAASLGVSLSACVPLVMGGAAGTAMVASDRRTSGAYVDDQAIELKAVSQMNQKLPDAHVNVTSFNRTVLMTGEVQTNDGRQQAELLVRALPGVSRVYNYTVVAEPSTLGQRNNDTWITAKVRGRLMSGKGDYSSQAIKLVSERGVVYLLGLVTPTEGDEVTALVSQTAGVLKVVPLFEYLTPIASTASQPVAQ
jgi:osmotically-inducible protein OsmY